jgi:hypothetical protein
MAAIGRHTVCFDKESKLMKYYSVLIITEQFMKVSVVRLNINTYGLCGLVVGAPGYIRVSRDPG